MTHPIAPAVEKAHTDVLSLFRKSTVGDPDGLAALCRAARDRLAALPTLDADDPSTWTSYELITVDVRTLLGFLREIDVPSSEPKRFRTLVIDVLRYLYMADRSELGEYLAKIVHTDWDRRLGESHVHTIDAVERLAACIHGRGDAKRARPVFEQILELRSAKFGDSHPSTLLAACNMGACLNQLEDFHTASQLNADTVRRCERRLGKDDPTTILAVDNLAGSLFGLGQLKMALTLYRDIHQRYRRVSGGNSLAALEAGAGIAITLHKLGDYEAARAINADLLPRFERVAGKDYTGTKNTRSRLVMNLRALGRRKEADKVHGGIPKFLPPP
ncbi:tetratricopeptide repeat protein [Streptomyces sp. NPDC058442]|uniref:tetratricopeptide repeat protein n=1 Tax=Streptomyces sp. NPDC058442 TaxID=3346503 RepID=UPI0036603C14